MFSAIQECSVERLTRLLTNWKNAGVGSCCVIMSIHLSEQGKTFVADSSDINVIIPHSHGFQSNINCIKRCIQHFQYQGNYTNICGVASIMSAIVLKKKDLYQIC